MKYKIWRVSKGQHVFVMQAQDLELAEKLFQKELDNHAGDNVEFLITVDGVIIRRLMS